MTLTEAVALAQSNDPTFLAAQANLNVSRERARQAIAGLLPELSIAVKSNANRRRYNQHTTPPQTDIPMERYNSNSSELNLTQPIWRHNNLIAMTQANLEVNKADFQLRAAAQDLLVRLAQSWFDAMQARDGITAAEAQLQATQQQFKLALSGHEKGVLSQTELEDIRARKQQAEADRSLAESDLEIKLAILEQIVGISAHTPPYLAAQFATPVFDAAQLEQWLSQAEANNPALLAALRGLDAANEEIHKQQAGHEPTLDLVASYGKYIQEAGLSGGQNGFDYRLGTVGIQFNIPLYAGGGQNAKVREALAQRDRAAQELEAARRKARLDTKQAWFTWRASAVREASTRQALQSALLAFNGAQAARSRGVKADFDVLQAQQQHETALRDWNKARYDTLISQIKLKAACGQLGGADLSRLDAVHEAIPQASLLIR